MENAASEHASQPRIGVAIAIFICGSALSVLLLHWMTRLYTEPAYGFAMFCGIPFVLGVFAEIARLLAGYRGVSATVSSVIAILVLSGTMAFVTGAEGLICLIMAFPIVFIFTLTGAALAFAVHSGVGFARRSRFGAFGAVVLLLPAYNVEQKIDLPDPVFEVTTSVHVNASPTDVWYNLVEFSEIPPPKEWVFKTGVAYPTHARIEGSGAGAIRYCEFTTGAFVEPIEVWDEPRRMEFRVARNPAPMEEFGFFENLEPPHLFGYLEAERGQFVLRELADGTTLLEGTTWYRHGLRPASYWRLWSDYIIHTIHRRVLEHIKTSAERGMGGTITAEADLPASR